MAPTWKRVIMIISTQPQTIQFTFQRGPGT